MAMTDFFLFDIWSLSKKSEEAAIEVCADLIGIVKTNTQVFCKDTIGDLTKDWPVCSYLLLRSKPRVPRGRLLIFIVSKYNVQKVLYYIVIEKIWSTQAGLPLFI